MFGFRMFSGDQQKTLGTKGLNNKAVIIKIKNVNKRSKEESITTFNFSTLYTTMPHGKVMNTNGT